MHFLRAPFIAAFLLLAGPAMLGPSSAVAARADLVDVSVFYEDLNEGGDWFEHPRHGYVWSPDVGPSWRPYTRGRWIYTSEYGWFWDSDEPFGWAVYHYGRWGYDEYDGWYWVPGRRWGPAWVAWRYGDEYAGWAPLPPGAVWSAELGIVYNDDFHVSVRFDPFWIFVRPRYITYYNPYRFARPRNRYRHIFRRTRPAAGFVYADGRIFFRGIGPRQYRRIARRSLPQTKVDFYHDSRPYKRRAKAPRGTVRIFRPGKNRRYRATRLRAPRVVHKTPPRRAKWKRRGQRPAAYKASPTNAKAWRKLRARRPPGAKTGARKAPPPRGTKAALPIAPKSAGDAQRKRRAKAKAKANAKAKAKRNAKLRGKAKAGAKSAAPKRGKRAVKSNGQPKGKQKGKRKGKKKKNDNT
jgi:hypothetical protein